MILCSERSAALKWSEGRLGAVVLCVPLARILTSIPAFMHPAASSPAVGARWPLVAPPGQLKLIWLKLIDSWWIRRVNEVHALKRTPNTGPTTLNALMVVCLREFPSSPERVSLNSAEWHNVNTIVFWILEWSRADRLPGRAMRKRFSLTHNFQICLVVWKLVVFVLMIKISSLCFFF